MNLKWNNYLFGNYKTLPLLQWQFWRDDQSPAAPQGGQDDLHPPPCLALLPDLRRLGHSVQHRGPSLGLPEHAPRSVLCLLAAVQPQLPHLLLEERAVPEGICRLLEDNLEKVQVSDICYLLKPVLMHTFSGAVVALPVIFPPENELAQNSSHLP